MTMTCGTGGWAGPLPGDPDNNVLLTATSVFGGVRVAWTMPASYPYAVAHVIIYRSTTLDYNNAIELATVNSNVYLDPNTGITEITYYYWISIVSINGTVGALIGPASALSRPPIETIIEQLSNRIESSELGTSLRGTLDNITLNAAAIAAEVNDRSFGDAAIAATLLTVQDDVTGNMALFNAEVVLRVDGDDVLAAAISSIAALNTTNAAAILNEQSARVTEDEAMTYDITKSFSAAGVNGAAVIGGDTTKIGYSASGNTPYDGNGVTIVYPIGTYPTIDYPYYHLDRKRIIDKLGVDLWNAIPANAANQLVWYAGLPLAAAVKSIGISDGVGYLTLEQRATAQKLVNGDLYGQYSVKIDAGGRVAGFGLSSTLPLASGTNPVSRFIVNADTFSVSKPLTFSALLAPNATVIGQTWFNETNGLSYIATATGTGNWVVDTPISPFIIDTLTGETYINDAVIKTLTFDKITDASGNTVIQDGKFRADALDLDWGGITDTSGTNKPADGATRNVYRGAWSVSTPYLLGDNVLYDGNTWECTLAHTGVTPPTYPTASNGNWVIVSVRGQGQVKGIAFTRGASATAPTGGSFTSPNPTTAGWSDGIPADDNTPLWMTSRIFTSDGVSPQQSVWSTPAKIGTPSTGSKTQFSIDGSTLWHDVPAVADYYMRAGTSTDNGATWSYAGAVKIKGEQGISGDNGTNGTNGTNGSPGLIDTANTYTLGVNGGFYTGTIARNPTTGVVSGTGVAMTGRGIAAAVAGVGTFNLDGSTGSASFGGTLTVGTSPAVSGTTMTGTGGVINTNGTFALGNSTKNISFNGTTLTVNGELVTTGNMAANSATLTVPAYTATAALNAPAGASNLFVTVQSATINALGAPIIVMASATFLTDASNTAWILNSVRLTRDGVEIAVPYVVFPTAPAFGVAIPINIVYSETPATGNHTYALQISVTNPGGATIWQGTTKAASMVLLGAKR